jgi:hypothetical protein
MSKSLTVVSGLVPGEGVEPPSPTYAVGALALSYPGRPRFVGWALVVGVSWASPSPRHNSFMASSSSDSFILAAMVKPCFAMAAR